ncbi:Protein of unknown function [Gryllus bimaculatus]|nr:Protein of unknown function [Gryllus bimaculatus]
MELTSCSSLGRPSEAGMTATQGATTAAGAEEAVGGGAGSDPGVRGAGGAMTRAGAAGSGSALLCSGPRRAAPPASQIGAVRLGVWTRGCGMRAGG